jgi:uncharacterized protein
MKIELNPGKNRFEVSVEGNLCQLEYELDDNVIHMNHVVVPKEVGGRGIAGELTRHALDHARSEGWRVVPNCPYVKNWIDRHSEYSDLVPDP